MAWTLDEDECGTSPYILYHSYQRCIFIYWLHVHRQVRYAQIARAFNLSTGRIGQIVDKGRRKINYNWHTQLRPHGFPFLLKKARSLDPEEVSMQWEKIEAHQHG